MTDIDALRALAKKRQRAVGQKISRIRRNVGAELAGTKFDPRKSVADINTMRSRELKSYINRLNSFQSRTNQFVQLSKGAPAPRSKWNSYVRAQTIVNERANEFNRAINPIVDVNNEPGSPNTIGMKKAQLSKSSIPTMQGEANKPFRMSDMISYKIKSLEALDKLEKLARKQSSPNYLKRQVKVYRERVNDALDKMSGSEVMKNEFNKLSDFQFMALWDRPGAFESFFAKYDSMQKRTVETIDSDDEFDKLWNGDHADPESQSDGLLEWARKIERPKDAPI